MAVAVICQLEQKDIKEFWNLFAQILKNDFPGYSPKVIDYFLNQVYTPTNFAYWLTINWRSVFLAKARGKIVGFAVIDKPYGGVSFCRWLRVKREFRNKGIGKQLLAEWLKSAKKSGCHKIELAGQKEAKIFYKKVGLILEGKRKLSYFGIDQDIFGKVIGLPNDKSMTKY